MSSVRSKRFRNLAVFLSMTAVLVLTGTLFLVIRSANRIIAHLEENIVVNVYFSRNAPQAGVQKSYEQALKMNQFEHAELSSPEKSATMFYDELGEDFLNVMGENPFPYSMQLFVNTSTNQTDLLEKAIPELEELPYVYEVDFMDGSANRIKENRNKISIYTALFTALFALIALVLINNTIRLQVYSDRFKVKSMQLVGADELFIQKPYLRRSAIVSVASAVVASLVVFLLYKVGIRQMDAILPSNITFQVSDIQIYSLLFVTLLITGLLIAICTSYFASKRYLRSKVDELY